MFEVVNHWCSYSIVAIIATVNAKIAKTAIFVIFYRLRVDVLATIDIIVALLAEQSKKQKDLMDYLGLEKGTFTKWKKGENQSYMKRINEISEFFDVSIDYLLGKTDIKKEPSIEEDAELMELLKKPALKAAHPSTMLWWKKRWKKAPGLPQQVEGFILFSQF